MNESGISIDEACANNVIGTKEEFKRNCNPDGTAKEHLETTTFSLKNSENSVTINNTYIQIGVVVVVILILLLAVLITRKLRRKLSK